MPLAADNAGTGKIFFVTPDGNLMTFDPATSLLEMVGALHHVSTTDRVSVSALEFNDLTGALLGVDSATRQIVEINPATAAVSVRTSVGAVPGGLTDLGFDPTGAGRLLGFVVDSLVPTANHFVQFKGNDQASQGGVIAASVGSLTIQGAYAGRVAANGTGFGSISDRGGDFTGILETPGTINTFTFGGGAFNGSLLGAMSINSASITGGVGANARIVSNRQLQSYSQTGGDFVGNLMAAAAGNLTVRGSVLPGAMFSVQGGMSSFNITGSFDGSAQLGATPSISIGGLLGNNAAIAVAGDTGTLAFRGGTGFDSRVLVTGKSNSLTVGGTFQGIDRYPQGLGFSRSCGGQWRNAGGGSRHQQPQCQR